jgi:hypothetical protein
MATQGYLLGSISLLDDWLKRDRFVFIGWSGLFLFPTAYLGLMQLVLVVLLVLEENKITLV